MSGDRPGHTPGSETATDAAAPAAQSAGKAAHGLAPGDAVDRYRVMALLGSGGMGQVYRARDPDLNRDVAVKVLHGASGGALDETLGKRLLREAQAMARLAHENIAIVHDLGVFRGGFFIAMEYVEGRTLAEAFRQEKGWRARLALVLAAGRGLAAAHRAGVIHRDFKPSNVLVGLDGKVKVVDFGLARRVAELEAETSRAAESSPRPPGPDALASQLTRTGSVLGTPAYMAPEQHEGRPTDERTDQFSFAVTAYEALYGERPFAGEDLATLADAVLAERIEPPSSTGRPRALRRVLLRALRRDPAARYPSLDELLTGLERAAGSARPRRRLALSLIAAVAAVAGAVMSWSARDRPVVPPAVPALGPGEESGPVVREVVDLDRAAFRAELGRRGLWKGAWIRPALDRDGRVVGSKLYAVKPGLFYALLELANGDTIYTIAGVPLTSDDRLGEVNQKLKDADRFVVSLRRSGERREHEYVLR